MRESKKIFIILVLSIFCLSACLQQASIGCNIEGFWKFNSIDNNDLNILFVDEESFSYYFSDFGYAEREYLIREGKLSLYYFENEDTIFSAKQLSIICLSNNEFEVISENRTDNYKRIKKERAIELINKMEELRTKSNIENLKIVPPSSNKLK